MFRARVWHELSVTYGQRADGTVEKDAADPNPADDRAEALGCAVQAASALEAAPQAPPVALTAAVGLNLGRCHRLLGQLDEGITAYENLLEGLPPDRVERPRALHELGNACLERSGRRDGRPTSGDAFRQDLEAARQRQTEALDLATSLDKCPDYLLAWIHNSLGLISRRQALLDEAVEHFTRAEGIFREGGQTDQQSAALQNLIQTLLEVGRYEQVREQGEKLEALPGVARDPRALITLGVAQLSLGNFTEASSQFDLARFVARERPQSADDPNLMAELAANAALCAQVSGDFEAAEDLLTEAHQKLTDAGGDPRTAAVIEANLGRMYLTLGRLDRAEAQLQAALKRQQELLGDQHPDTLLTLLDLAALTQERARYGEAQTLCESALTGLQAALGPDHPLVGTAHLALASVFNDRRRCPETGAHTTRAVEIFDAALGRHHKRSIDAVLRATLYAAGCQDTTEGAARFRALRADATHRFEQLRNTLGPDHVDVLKALVLFADINARTPEAYARALEVYQTAEAGFLKSFGDRHLSLAELRWGQGRLLAEMGQLDEAFGVYTNALNRLDRTFERHPIRAKLLEGLGDVLESRGQEEQARQYHQQAYGILVATYGSTHPLVKSFESRHGR